MKRLELRDKILFEFTKLNIPMSRTGASDLTEIEGIEDTIITPDNLPINTQTRPECLKYDPYTAKGLYHFKYPEKKEMQNYLRFWIEIPDSIVPSISATTCVSLIRYCTLKQKP